MSELIFGPQTVEIEIIVNKLSDPLNRDVADATLDREMMSGNSEVFVAYDSLDALLSASGRIDEVLAAIAAVSDATPPPDEPGTFLYWSLGRNISALVVRDLIGKSFTQQHFDCLTKNLVDFLALVDGTLPNSPERKIALGLKDSIGGTRAVLAATAATANPPIPKDE